MKHVVWGILFGLVLLHQSGIAADDTALVFGFLPIGLLFHAGISIGAAITWLLATKSAWPQGLEPSPAASAANGRTTNRE